MKRWMMPTAAFVLVPLFAWAVTASPLDEKTVTITDKDKDVKSETKDGKTEMIKGDKVELAKGDKLIVKLPSNRTTGFSWTMGSKESDVLKSAGKPEYEPGDKKAVGSGGTDVFTFTAGAKGDTEIELQYKRPFEKDKEPAKIYKFKVTVK
jgi:inhibitor of cysteine peptidase